MVDVVFIEPAPFDAQLTCFGAVPVISVVLFSSPQVYENVIRNVRLLSIGCFAFA